MNENRKPKNSGAVRQRAEHNAENNLSMDKSREADVGEDRRNKTNNIKNKTIIMETQRTGYYPPINADVIDHVCAQIEMGITPNRWNVIGKESLILSRLLMRGTYIPSHDQMLWELSDAAKESL